MQSPCKINIRQILRNSCLER